ncbi:hypothetical protein MPTK1_2g22750 [Marchantia polymorpha subsp. ruderalis]|uniref:F-box domain-containing protein n=1 Tax=Marchantia polymorpha TaxID=3197 RepID=A0A2R6WN86_MARPO|nr:hypothetical protein MARPO_0072s0056 [Marchantia polymorpha]BBN03338.1 hypothetical protein Mp_2g22750 [Marchantia polymorpha subsp. ruderalis]|eukprot:PTQ35313.1 hypothetical protein MARPO_0072s0056 [Marchantia polymorpha]
MEDHILSPSLEDIIDSSAGILKRLTLLNPVDVEDMATDEDTPGSSSLERGALGRLDGGNGCSTSQAGRLGILRHTSDGTFVSPEFDMDVQEQENVAMDPKVWSELPEHLMDSILAWLPLPSFLRVRSVCKKWNSLVQSPSFLQLCAEVPPQAPFFLMYADLFQQRYAAYDPSLNKWHLLPLSCFLSGPSLSQFVVLAAAGGLLCLGGTSGSVPQGRNGYAVDPMTKADRNLYVSNPITKIRRKLPPMLRMQNPYIVGMVIDSAKKSYKILVAQEGEHLKLQVYDSISNSWELTDSLRRRVALVVGTAYMHGILYCLTFGPGIGVSTYHVDAGCWQDLRARMPPCLTCPQLFENRGCLMMVGGIEEFGSIKSIHVWRLDEAKREWVEVLRMPDNLLHELSSGPPGGHFLFVAHGDHICFTYYRAKEMLMCNLYRNAWWWLPRCTLDDYLDARSVLGFSLEPRLDAAV